VPVNLLSIEREGQLKNNVVDKRTKNSPSVGQIEKNAEQSSLEGRSGPSEKKLSAERISFSEKRGEGAGERKGKGRDPLGESRGRRPEKVF